MIDSQLQKQKPCIQDTVCKGDEACYTRISGSLKCMAEKCMTDENRNDDAKMDACLENEMKGECNKMTEEEAKLFDSCYGNILIIIYGLIALFLMI